MARRLLLGRAGTGKTHRCLAQLAAALEAGRRALLLVPTYSQAEHLRYLLLDRTKGLMDRAVETFETLAEDVTRLRLRDLVRPAAKDRLAGRALESGFPEAATQPGLRAEFLSAVKEIKEQGEDPLAHARAHFAEGSRGRRLFEAFARYKELLPPAFDHEDLLLACRDRLRGKAPPLDLLLVDGFHDFTPVQRQIVELLAAAAKDTVVTLPLDPEDRTHPIFQTAARTCATFRGYAEEALDGNRRASGGLAAIERDLFAKHGGLGGAELLICPSEEDEADRLARLVARSGRPFHDFLLVRRSFDGLHDVYRAAFRRHGVPLRFFSREGFQGTPAARAATLWLRALAGERLEPREALPLLRSPYYLERPQADLVDDFARELADPRQEHELPEGWMPRGRGPLPAVMKRHLGLKDALASTPDGDEDLSRAATLFEMLLKEAEAVDPLPLAEAAAQVLGRLPLLEKPARDRRHDCVYAVDASDARQWDKPVVLVAGLTSDAFPRQVRQDLFLRDEEREAFATARGFHLPLRARREDEERYLFYVAVTRARERLLLSYPAYDEQGVPRAPSPYVEEFDRCDVRRIEISEQYAQPADAVSRDDLLPIVADGIVHGSPLAASLLDLEAVPRDLLAWPRRLELSRARPLAMSAREPRLSASSINAWRRCPYLLLVRHILRVDRPREPGLDPLLKGDIAHTALERCAGRPDEDPRAIFDEVFLEKAKGLRLGLVEEADRRALRASVAHAAKRLSGTPVETVEWKFDIDVAGAKLRGRIDRIERYPAGQLVRDFKTGRAEGLDDTQLDAYVLALPEAVGAVYERLKKGDVQGYAVPELARALGVEAVSREDLLGKRDAMRRLVGTVADAWREGRLAVKPADPEKCTRTQCDGYDLCRVARARFLVKAGRPGWQS
ncbi:MAG TPA: PD-(D/E)XK nuclease family protein [Planctomycetota bacterium]|nr:PD-(D/E)XK nuclease family protein [Planctomycetota bacterium]